MFYMIPECLGSYFLSAIDGEQNVQTLTIGHFLSVMFQIILNSLYMAFFSNGTNRLLFSFTNQLHHSLL